MTEKQIKLFEQKVRKIVKEELMKENRTQFGMKWSELKNGKKVMKEKFFTDHNAMMGFLSNLVKSPTFNRVELYHGNDQFADDSEMGAPTSR